MLMAEPQRHLLRLLFFHYSSAAECLPVCILSCTFLWHTVPTSALYYVQFFSWGKMWHCWPVTGGLSERQFSCWVSHICEVGHCRNAYPNKQKPISTCIWKEADVLSKASLSQNNTPTSSGFVNGEVLISV